MKIWKKLSVMFVAVLMFAGVLAFNVSASEPSEGTDQGQTLGNNIRIGISYSGDYSNYVSAVRKAGAIPVKLPLVSTRTEARLALYNVDALIISGGTATDPFHYGAEESEHLGEIAPERDASDMLLIKVAKEIDMPTIGICRGMQIMNILQGGNMYQSIKYEYDGVLEGLVHNKTGGDEFTRHDITIEPGSKLYNIVKNTELEVMSSHFQALKDIGSNLVVTARAADGITEAIEFTNQTFMIGVQFHPEKAIVTDNTQLEFIYALMEEGTKYRERMLENMPAPEVVSSVLTAHDDIKVFWDDVAVANGYSVYYKRVTEDEEYQLLGHTKTTSIQAKDLRDGFEYSFKVVPHIEREGEIYEADNYGLTEIYTLKKIENLQANDYSPTRVRLTWDDIEGQTGYQFSESTSKTKTNIVETYKTKTGSAKQLVNKAGVKYYYKVRAYKVVAGEYIYGPWSDPVEYKRELAAPENMTVRLTGYNDVKVTWDAVDGATGYAVYYKRATAESYTLLKRTTSKSASKSDLTSGKNYQFKVVPYRKVGDTRYNSKNYSTAKIYTLKKVEKPSVSTSLLVDIKVKWTDISGETGYQISRTTSKSSVKVIATIDANETSAIVDRSAKKGKYYYKVRAYKVENGSKIYGPWSDAVSYSR